MILNNLSAEYKNIFVQSITDVYKVMYEQQIGNMNAIWRNFVSFLMKYNYIKMQLKLGEDERQVGKHQRVSLTCR